MKKGAGITEVALPFAAGVAAAAAAGRPFEGALACSAAAALALALTLRRGRSTAAVAALFAALGGLCRCSAALSPAEPVLPALAGAMDRLQEAILAAGFPGDNSPAIITALLTGRRGALPRATVEAFRRSGASHILALSGMHLGVIYLFIRRLLAPAGNSRAARTMVSITVITICGMYTLATGAGPSITRAFLFILIREISAASSGRRSSAAGTWCLALTVQLALNPAVISSVGFQLSYLAMLGITVLYPPLEKWYPASGRRPAPLRTVWKAAALSTSCQLFTAPVAWWHFRTLPKFFIITNLLALPLTEAIIITALASLLLGVAGICPPILVEACGKLVQLLEFCLETVASM